MNDRQREEIVQLLTAEQLPLLRYIATLVGNADEARNILQETNLVIWRKAEEFAPGSNFSAWSRKIAYWQTLAALRDRRRERLVFSEALIQQLAERPAAYEDDEELRLALRHCLGELPHDKRELVRQRYSGGLSLQSLAERLHLKPGNLKVALLRTRRALLRCIERQLAQN